MRTKGVDVTYRLGGCCREYIEHCTLELVPKKEFFVKWTRNGDTVCIQTSDYMDDAPDSVIRGIAVTVCRRLRNRSVPLPQEFFDHVRSEAFIRGKRPDYISRSRNLMNTTVGRSFDIRDSISRLLDSGLITKTDIDNSYFSWTKHDAKRKVGFCSTMFRVVGISSILDDPSVPDSVRDFVVYHECLHLRQKFRIPHNAHSGLFREYEHRFPGWEAAEEFLTRL